MRRIAVLVLTVLTFTLAACGGDDDAGGEESAGTAADATTTTADGREQSREERAGKGDRNTGGGDSSRSSGGGSDGGGSGGASGSRDDELRGDGSIQRFGEEGDSDERDAAAAVAEDYYAAMAAQDWRRSCELLADDVKEGFERLAEQAPQMKGKGCPQLLAGLTAGRGADAMRAIYDPAKTSFEELRVEGDRAFLLMESPQLEHGFLPMSRDGDDWRVAGLGASPL